MAAEFESVEWNAPHSPRLRVPRTPFFALRGTHLKIDNRIFFKKSEVLQSLQTPGFGGRYSANRKPTRPK